MKTKNIGTFAAAGTLAMMLGYACGTTYVKPNEWGVKQVKMSPAGVFGQPGWQSKALEGGEIYLNVPGFVKVHTLPRDTQALHFNMNAQQLEHNEYGTSLPAVRIETSDAYYVDMDVTILYRIVDPAKAITKLGPGIMYESSGIVPRAGAALKAELGKLNPEDFFEIDTNGTPKRIQYQTKAKEKLNADLKEYGLDVKDVLIRYPKYHEAVQKRFENKTEQDQLFFTEQSEARLAQENALLKKLQTEGAQAAGVRQSEGNAYFNTIQGQVQAYKATKESEGNRLEREAMAEGSRLINEAYRGEGSERLVGMKMAENLKNLDEIIVTTCGEKGFNPLNLDKTMKQVSGKN